LKLQKVFFGEAKILSEVVNEIFMKNNSNDDNEMWPSEPIILENKHAAAMWKEKWLLLHTVTRSSIAMLCCDKTLDPIQESLKEYIRTLEEETRVRNALLKDYDSHRRRLRKYEDKMQSLVHESSVTTAANRIFY
jgi:BAR domain